MLSSITRCCTLLLVLAVLVISAANARACPFDIDYFQLDRLESTGLKWHHFSDEKLQLRGVSAQDHLVSARYWACEKLGVDAMMLVHFSEGNEKQLRDAILELGSIALPPTEYARLAEHVRLTSRFPSGTAYHIAGPENQSEFYYKSTRLVEGDVISIRFYYN